jgi:two-component system CheB/CheR fusion protein
MTPESPRGSLLRLGVLLQTIAHRRELGHSPELSNAILWETGPDGALTFVSRGWTEYTGQPQESALGAGCMQAIHPDDRERACAAFMAALGRREPFAVDYRLRRADGVYRWVMDSGRPRYGGAGELLGYLGSILDVHELSLAEEARRESEARLHEFLATLSHELRNPLAPLRNSLQFLRLADEHDAALAPLREMMERQVEHLVRLVDDLLEMSRIKRGALELRREPVDLAEVVRNAMETSGPLIEQAAHRLEVSLPPEPLRVNGDPVRLTQILANLLNNAARYTGRGGDIRVKLERRDASALISVRDSGAGIAPELLPRLFQMFSRGEASSGLGIGLALARRLAQMHGGEIEARSEGAGRGAEFLVRLPLSAGAPPAARPRADGSRLARQRILLVDDNRDAADSLAKLLTILGAEVEIASDGPGALAAFERSHPDAVLLDIGLPGMDGYEVARRLRALPAGGGVSIIALTGWGQEEDKRRAREAGFDRHLIKPVDLGVLRALLGSVAPGS